MDQLCNYQYHHSKGFSLEQLPPTSHAQNSHILRTQYATYEMITIRSHTKVTLNPTRYDFQARDDLLMPDMAIQHNQMSMLFNESVVNVQLTDAPAKKILNSAANSETAKVFRAKNVRIQLAAFRINILVVC